MNCWQSSTFEYKYNTNLYSINLFRHLSHIKMLRSLPRTGLARVLTTLATQLLLQTASRCPAVLALHSGNTITLHLSAIFFIQMD